MSDDGRQELISDIGAEVERRTKRAVLDLAWKFGGWYIAFRLISWAYHRWW